MEACQSMTPNTESVPDASPAVSANPLLEPGPFHCPIYDVHSVYRYEHLLRGQYVRIEEKLNGANVRLCYSGGRFYVGSRKTWQKEHPTNVYWRAFGWDLREYLREFPDLVFYGEVFGPNVQGGFTYGLNAAEIRLFDVWNPELQAFEERSLADTKYQLGYFAPKAEAGFFWLNPEECLARVQVLAESRSAMPLTPHIREGVIIRAWGKDTTSREVPYGRLVFKALNWEYIADKGRARKVT